MDTITALTEALLRVERIMRASMKAHEGMAELRQELIGEKIEGVKRDLSALTDRQKQIFELIGQDAQIADIAKKFGLSPRTVEAHRNTIREKLNFATSAELETFAKAMRG